MTRKKKKNRMPPEVVEAVQGRSQHFCEALIPKAGCNGRGEQMHHRQMRSQGGQHLVVNLIHVCHLCHSWIHMHPAISYTNGWLVKSTGDPAQAPVKRRGGFIVLTEEGGFQKS